MAKRLDKAGCLGASFFFIRGIEKLSTIHFVVPTIAFQLANNIPELRRPIVEAVRAYVAFNETQQLEHQLDALLVKPFQSLPLDHSPVVIIIDAVDECTQSGQDEVAHFLYLLMKSVYGQSLPLRILLTTHPEIHIERPLTSVKFCQIAKPFKLQDVPLDTVNMDITRYVEVGLSRSPFKTELQAVQPNIVAELTGQSRGLFIYASVACNFIFGYLHYSEDAVCRLNQWLSVTGAAVPAMTKPLDTLYLSVLNQGFPESILERPNYLRWIQEILASVALLQDQISPKTLESLIGMPVDVTMEIISQMASVILPCKDADMEICPVHASFPQFLIDKARCSNPQFFINPLTHHGVFASKCLTLLVSPGVLQMKQKYHVPAYVAYACQHWPTHIVSSQASSALLTLLQDFLKRDLLLWFGALSVMKRLRSAAPALSSVQQWVQNITDLDVDKQIPSLLNDGYRFILEYIVPIEIDPMQIYISALPMMPTCLLQELYTPHYQHLPAMQLLSKRDSGWGPCLSVIEGYKEHVTSVKYSPDGHYIVTGSLDGTVCTWHADSGTPLNIMRGHKHQVYAVDFYPDLHRPAEIVSVSCDNTLCIWDFASGAPLHSIPTNEESCCVAYSPDGKKIVAGSWNSGFKIWDAITTKLLVQADVSFGANRISFSPNGKLIVTTQEKMVHIWDAHIGNLMCSLEDHNGYMKCVTFFPDGRRVASGGGDQDVFIWDVETKTCLRQLVGHTDWIYAIAISPKGDLIASGSRDCTVCLWDAESGELVNILRGHTLFVISLCFSPNGHTLVSASGDTTVRIWDIVGPSSGMRKIEEYLSAITCVEFSSDMTIIATGSEDGLISIWETQTGKQLHYYALECHIDSLTISPDNQTLTCGIYAKSLSFIWNISTGKFRVKRIRNRKNIFIYSPDRKWVASISFNILHIWVASNGILLWTVPISCGLIRYFAFSCDSKLLKLLIDSNQMIIEVSTGRSVRDSDAFIYEWEWESQTPRAQFLEKNGWIISKATGKKLAWTAGSKRGKLIPSTNNATYRFHGKCYATGSYTGQLTIIDLSKLED
ncbi:hypothetical protein QCA50_009716 [Cerrena zonata]|uniref:Nephrocystin 3-like N-terminal domain-containing protein n=1 Tax=Cerrena zonata TaxID=2478898 RepID=A0AAW0GC76_9APHY